MKQINELIIPELLDQESSMSLLHDYLMTKAEVRLENFYDPY